MLNLNHTRTGVSIKLSIVWMLLTLASLTTTDIPRPRGVSLTKTSLYKPRDDKSWNCLDGSRNIRFLQINDDYCDCKDGSDEPGTAACLNGNFHCVNRGHRSLELPSSRVNDGICDCCDGSDEYDGSVQSCSNTCAALGRAEQELRKSEAELHKRGAAKRAEMIAKGKQLSSERDSRRSELDKRKVEQETIKAEKEELKRQAEAVEAEALEFYKEQQRELEESKKAAEEVDGATSNRLEAEAKFVRYDTNKDGFVEISELQVDMILDRDRNGVVTVEETKYFLDERDRIDLETFVALAWPRIKSVQMLAEGLFKPPVEAEEVDQVQANEQVGQQEPLDEHHQEEHFEDDEEEEHFDDEEEADVGVGSATPETTPTPEYDPETQHLIELANEARNAFSEVEREIRDIEHEIKEIDELNAKDYGPLQEYASMDGECYAFEDREYVYTLCPFDRASQKQRSGGSETTLGRWDQWMGEGVYKYTKQRYAHGASCWNGPQRSALVNIKCALEPRITAVSEPNRCEYQFEFETPAACDDVNHNASQNEHDEL